MSESPYLGLASAAQRLAIDGKPLHVSAIYRQMTQGIKRGETTIKLRHVRLGRRLATTDEWISEFIRELASTPSGPRARNATTKSTRPSHSRRQREIAVANKELATRGY